MPKVHDRGGWPTEESINRTEHQVMDWELHIDGLRQVLIQKGIMGSIDELRRAIESLEPQKYESLRYYERWVEAVELLLVEKGVLTKEEIETKVEDIERQTANDKPKRNL